MRVGKSSKSGKIDYIHQHHIIEKRFDKKSNKTITLTVSEHADIHSYTDKIKTKDGALGMFFCWILGKKFFG